MLGFLNDKSSENIYNYKLFDLGRNNLTKFLDPNTSN